mgnify:FL=1
MTVFYSDEGNGWRSIQFVASRRFCECIWSDDISWWIVPGTLED